MEPGSFFLLRQVLGQKYSILLQNTASCHLSAWDGTPMGNHGAELTLVFLSNIMFSQPVTETNLGFSFKSASQVSGICTLI